MLYGLSLSFECRRDCSYDHTGTHSKSSSSAGPILKNSVAGLLGGIHHILLTYGNNQFRSTAAGDEGDAGFCPNATVHF